MVTKKNTTVSSSKTERANDELASVFSDEEKKLIKQDNAQDVSIANTLKNYMSTMAKGQLCKNIVETQVLFWDTLQVVFKSAPEDYNRRMNILMHYAEKMTVKDGALHGKLPMRAVTQLPPRVDVQAFAYMMSFLSMVGPKETRRVALRNTNMDNVCKGVPKTKHQNFKQYFNFMR